VPKPDKTGEYYVLLEGLPDETGKPEFRYLGLPIWHYPPYPEFPFAHGTTLGVVNPGEGTYYVVKKEGTETPGIHEWRPEELIKFLSLKRGDPFVFQNVMTAGSSVKPGERRDQYRVAYLLRFTPVRLQSVEELEEETGIPLVTGGATWKIGY
jgi:hypothetical protein